MSNEEIIWNYLTSKLNNQYGAAGLMGNLFAESSLNPILANNVKKIGKTSEQYTNETDNGTYKNFAKDSIAYGLAQWCYSTRKQGLLDKATSLKKSVGDINVQLEYLWEELQKYKTVLSTLTSATNVRDASDVVLVKYEKPATQTEAVKSLRAKYGQKYYDKYAKKNDKVDVMISALMAREILRSLKE